MTISDKESLEAGAERNVNISDEQKLETVDHYRKFKGIWRWINSTALIAYISMYLLIILGVFDQPGFRVTSYQFLYLTVGGAVIFTLCYFPATKTSPLNKLSWYDLVLIAAVIPTTVYLWFNWYDLKFNMAELSLLDYCFMGAAFIAFNEAVRRVTGWVLPFFGLLMLLYIFVAPYLPGILECRPHSLGSVIEALFIGEDGFYGSIMDLVVFQITGVFIFGTFLRILGADRYFTDFANSLAGRSAGAGAKVAVIGSGLFGMLSGSGVANVVTTGVITIPMMKRQGYRPEFAGAVEAVASTGGTFMPPVMGAVAFIMANFLGISYWTVCAHAFVPAVLYYFILYLQVHFEALRVGIKPLALEIVPSFREVAKKGWVVGVPIVVLMYLLGGLGWSIQTSFLYATLSLMVVACLYRETRPTPRRIVRALVESGQAILTFVPLILCVGAILVSINITGIGVRIMQVMAQLGSTNVLLLLIVALAGSFVMGMAVSGIATYILLAIFIAPGATSGLASAGLKIEPVSLHLFLMYIATTSMITPPVCLAVYAACSIAKSELWRTGYEACRLGLGMFILPFAFITNQHILMFGSPGIIAWEVFTAVVACVMLAAGANGYFFFTSLSPVYRIILFLSGLAALTPWLSLELISIAVMLICVAKLILSRRTANKIAGVSVQAD